MLLLSEGENFNSLEVLRGSGVDSDRGRASLRRVISVARVGYRDIRFAEKLYRYSRM